LEEELDMVDAGGTGVMAIGVSGCQCRVNKNKTPTVTSSASWEIRDEEELAGAGSNSRGKGSRPRSRCRCRCRGKRCREDDGRKGIHGSKGRKRASMRHVKEHSWLSGGSGVAGRSRRRWVREPHFVALFNVQVAFQRVGQRSMAMVEAAEVRAVNRRARKDARGDGQQHVARVGKRIGIGWVHRHNFVTAGGMGEDTTWATALVRKLGNLVEFSITLDLNADKDAVIWSKAGSGATCLDAFAMGLRRQGPVCRPSR
jgi:hypothetical protein